MANPTLTVLAAAGLTVGQVADSFREATLKTQTQGFQNLGTIDNVSGSAGADESKLTHNRFRLFYDPTGNIIYALAI